MPSALIGPKFSVYISIHLLGTPEFGLDVLLSTKGALRLSLF